MANTVKINVGSLGCLGGEGNLRDVSLHDSTCQCEGCVEKRLADREFTIGADPFSTERDVGCSKEENEEDLIILDSDVESVSDIFDIHDDPPASNDDGYCDDGNDSDDAYSVFSPKPCSTIDDQPELVGGLDDIEEEDTPPIETEDTINDASIEASKRDGSLIEECSNLAESNGNDAVSMKNLEDFLDTQRLKVAKFWRTQITLYESKVIEQSKLASKYADGIRAAKRRMDYDSYEIRRLRDLCMDKTREVNKKDEKIYKLAEEANEWRRCFLAEECIRKSSIARLEAALEKEKKRNDTLEEELMTTRQRLHTYTRRSVPRRCKRKLRRRIMIDDEDSTVTAGSNSDTEVDDENDMDNTLIRIMDYDD